MGHGHHLVLQLINQGLADLPDSHTGVAVPAPEVVVEVRVLVSSHEMSQGAGQLQSSTQGLSQVGASFLDDRPDPLMQLIELVLWYLHIIHEGFP